MTRIIVSRNEDQRWDQEVHKTVHESLPYYVEGFIDARFDDEGVEIEANLKTRSEEETRHRVEKLISDIVASLRSIRAKPIDRAKAVAAPAACDPYDTLVANGSIKPTGRGKFVYAGDVAEVFAALDRTVLELALDLGAKQELYPTTVETGTLLKSGYLEMHPQFAYFVAPAHLDQEALVQINNPDTLDMDKRRETTGLLSVPDQILAPTVCYHTFEARQGEVIEPSIVTALNKCHRHEPVRVTSLERLTTYWMREIVVFGTKEEVADTLDRTCDWSCNLIRRLGLGFELVTASDPFFADRGASNRLLQSALTLKREIKMPLFGDRSTAIASFNNHVNSLTDKFDVKTEADGVDALASGCVGWGYDRLIYALFCGLGEQLVDWPAEARKVLGL